MQLLSSTQSFIQRSHQNLINSKRDKPFKEDIKCDHDWMYKILYDHTAADVCTKCGKIELQVSNKSVTVGDVLKFKTLNK